MDSFCNRVFLKKQFIKCISRKTNKCYLFVGRIPLINPIIKKIKDNKKGKKEHFNGIDEEELRTLYQYLNPEDFEEYDVDEIKQYLTNSMYLDYEDLVIKNVEINEDDTNEVVLYKIIYNCYPKEKYISHKPNIIDQL